MCDPLNFKAHYRRALALYELGDLPAALRDASAVVDHYYQEDVQNPEASRLKERIMEDLKAEQKKWGGSFMSEIYCC